MSLCSWTISQSGLRRHRCYTQMYDVKLPRDTVSFFFPAAPLYCVMFVSTKAESRSPEGVLSMCIPTLIVPPALNTSYYIITQQGWFHWFGTNKDSGCVWPTPAGIHSAAGRTHNLSPPPTPIVLLCCYLHLPSWQPSSIPPTSFSAPTPPLCPQSSHLPNSMHCTTLCIHLPHQPSIFPAVPAESSKFTLKLWSQAAESSGANIRVASVAVDVQQYNRSNDILCLDGHL